jgi:hypothetical protein
VTIASFDKFDEYLTGINKWRSISLETIQNQEDLFKRFDSKYISDENTVIKILGKIDSNWKILNVNQKITIKQEGDYYDTQDFQFFKDHKKGKRKRFKIRVKSYENSVRYLELKLKTNIEETLKFRWRYGEITAQNTIDIRYRRQLLEKLEEYSYRVDLNSTNYKLTTSYLRTTLFNLATREKLTIDQNFVVKKQRQIQPIGGSKLILEVKSIKSRHSLIPILNTLNIRKGSISKYGISAPLIYPELGRNPWIATLKGLGS